jgi:hypothetical protein
MLTQKALYVTHRHAFAQKVKPKINSNEILKAADEARSPSGNLGFEVTINCSVKSGT